MHCQRQNRSIIKQSLQLGLVLLGIATPALSQSALRVGVANLWTPGLNAAQKQYLIQKIAEEFQKNSRLTFNTDAQTLELLSNDALSNQDKVAELNEAYEHLKVGKQAYIGLDLNLAQQELEKARKLFITNLHLIADNQGLLESHLYLGMIYVANENQNAAVAEFRRVALLDPELNLTTKNYAPEIVAAFTQAKTELHQEDIATLLVESLPEAATVYINGKSSGTTPLNLQLPVGEYFIRLSKPGHQDWYQLYKAQSGIQKLRKNLAEAVSAEENAAQIYRIVTKEYPTTPLVLETLQAKANQMQVDLLLLGELEDSEHPMLTMQWYDKRTQEFGISQNQKIKGDFSALLNQLRPLVKALSAQVRQDGYITVDKSLTLQTISPRADASIDFSGSNTPPPLKLHKPWYRKWWIWGAVGIVATAVITTTIIANDSGSANIIVDNSGNIP